MAVTAFTSSSNQTVNIWSSLTMREALKATLMKKFMGKDSRAIIQRIANLEKSAGDLIKYDLLMQMSASKAIASTGMGPWSPPSVKNSPAISKTACAMEKVFLFYPEAENS